ncbi:hypothetical protein [Bartonella sp. CB189]|uniref:hypothetical protein n=1 Tax=Bartonella sp. CB189 TaxID=3112254 RepID=UPI002F963E77
MVDFKPYSNVNSNNWKRILLQKVFYPIKELALIGSLNGSVSGAIAAILAAHGYIALPGFGPIIAMGVSVAFLISATIGAIIGSIIGIIAGAFCAFIGNLFFIQNILKIRIADKL